MSKRDGTKHFTKRGSISQKGGGQTVEQLPAKIKGGSYVSQCEDYGVFVVFVLLFVCVFLKNTIKLGFQPIWGHLKNWVQNVGSMSGPHLGR